MKARRILGIVLGLVLALLAAGAGLLYALFDGEKIKGELIRVVLEQKQRKLEIPGKLELSVWPGVSIKGGPLTLSGAGGKEEFLALGRANLADDTEYFGMTPLAIRMCRSANGVSEKHGEVSRELWLKMFPDLADAGAVPITSVTNGVHPPTWIAPLYQDLFTKTIDKNWHEIVRQAGDWERAINAIPDADIWNAHQDLKALLIAFIRERTRSKNTGEQETIHENETTRGLFSRDVLTIGFARRVAAYKRWDLLFSDLPRLLGRSTKDLARELGAHYEREVIHRDDLAVL